MSEPLVFYDIRSSLPLEQCSWTLFILRIRLALNYKQIPYKTVWVEFADVQAVGKRIGATPSTTYPDGTPRYTLPTIYDPNTGRTVSDSVAIAKYLDEQYSEHRLFPDGTVDAQVEFANNAIAVVGSDALLPLYVATHDKILLEARNRDALEKLIRTYFNYPPFAEYIRSSTAIEHIFRGYGHLLDALENTKTKTGLATQPKIFFVDIVVGACLRCMQLAWRNEADFQALLKRDGGKGQKVWDKAKDYLGNDEGEAWVA